MPLPEEIVSREFGKAAELETDGRVGFVDKFGFAVDKSEIDDGAATVRLPDDTTVGEGEAIGVCVPVPTDGGEAWLITVLGLAIGAGNAGDDIPDDGTIVAGELFWFGICVADCVGLVIGIGEWE